MKTVEDYEEIRRAYFIEGLSIRAIQRRLKHDRKTIRKAIVDPVPKPYQLEQAKPSPVLGPYQERIQKLLEEGERLPRKQRYTARKIFQIIQGEGYQGSQGGVHNYVSQRRKARQKKEAFIPLEFDAGQDAQVDWGEAVARIAGQPVKVQFFNMRLNYSKARFVMAFPFQKQEAFFEGHIQAFHFFGGYMRNRQEGDEMRLENHSGPEYNEDAQRKREKTVAPSMTFSRFHYFTLSPLRSAPAWGVLRAASK